MFFFYNFIEEKTAQKNIKIQNIINLDYNENIIIYSACDGNVIKNIGEVESEILEILCHNLSQL